MILFTGRGSSGSWQIRGVQLGVACGANVVANASLEQMQQADCIVVVKRVTPPILDAVRKSGKPWIYDIVDAYPQPECSTWDKGTAFRWIRNRLRELRPTAVVWPNKQMQEDCDSGIHSTVIYHHCRAAALNPIREAVAKVGYEGSPAYIGGSLKAITEKCAKRGWTFHVNPPSLADLDIVLSVRDGAGYVQRHWKSNVKLSNAHGTGTPFIGPKECGYLETATGLEQWAESVDDLDACFDALVSRETRQDISTVFLTKRYTVDHAARDMRHFIREVCGAD